MVRKRLIDFSYLDDHLLKLTEFGATFEIHPRSMESLLSDELLMAISHIGLPKTYNPYDGILKTEHFDPDVFLDIAV
ncbi:hypothetical protein AAAA28_18880 [Providencia stuartii]|uniref:hypothetical protein n=1 Tax=Providencia stuartii TaxID=588 RepID=UPI0030F20514